MRSVWGLIKAGLAILPALSLTVSGCASKNGTYVSGIYDPDLEYAPGQCVALTKPNIDALKRQGLEGKKYVYYCKVCNDKEPEGPYTFGVILYTQATKLSWYFGPTKNSSFDAANLYIETSPNRFYNLAKLIGCPAKSSTEIYMQ